MGALGIKGAKEVGKNTYQLTVYTGNDGSGKYGRKYKTVQAKNKKELEAARAQFIYEVKQGLVGDRGSMLFRDLVKDWYKNHLAGKSPRTIEGYESNLRLRILPSFGTMHIGKIEKYHVRQFFDKLAQPGCEFNSILPSPDMNDKAVNWFTSADENDFIFKQKKYTLSAKTIDNHKICMNSIFSYAIYKEYIKESPMKGLKTPKLVTNHSIPYNKEDIAAMLNALDNEPILWQSIVLFALSTGTREGEIAALRKDRIDLEKGIVIISQSAIRVKGKGIAIKSTKSGRERLNKIPENVLNKLRKYDSNRIDKGNDFFFVPEINARKRRGFRPENIGQWWRRFLVKHKLKHIRFHDLRHVYAALSIDAGDNMKAISERLGHSSIDITADRYGFLFKDAATRSAELLGGEIKKLWK